MFCLYVLFLFVSSFCIFADLFGSDSNLSTLRVSLQTCFVVGFVMLLYAVCVSFSLQIWRCILFMFVCLHFFCCISFVWFVCCVWLLFVSQIQQKSHGKERKKEFCGFEGSCVAGLGRK